jgi:DNA-binding response OmpR family regulator
VETAGRPSKVLVVEDEPDLRELFIFALEVAGFVARGAESVARARELLAVDPPDALIADYGLPDGTGVTLLALCAEARPKVCVLLTGHDARDISTDGFDAVLMKPILPEALVAAIRTRISKA